MRPFRSHGSTRLEAFSDAAFAFALTMLVVSLDVPRSYDELMDRMYGVGSFACCFALLVWIWFQHAEFFRKYPLEDPLTVVINSALLFVVMFYVYPLKFMFDSMFALFLPQPTTMQPVIGMQFWQLANASAVYGLGFVLLFLLFALLHHRAYRQRDRLQLGALDLYDLRTEVGHHFVSAGVGGLALVYALVAPLTIVFVSPMLFAFMGPGHYWWGTRRAKRRPKATPAAQPAEAL